MPITYGKVNRSPLMLTLVKSITPDDKRRSGRTIIMSLWKEQLIDGDFANMVDNIEYTPGNIPDVFLDEEYPAEEFEKYYQLARINF